MAAAVLLPLVFYARATFTSQVFLGRDLQRVYLPLKSFWAERIRQGELPAWYPFDGFGQPFVGMVVSGAYSPFNLLHLVLSDAFAMKWSLLLGAVLAFSGVVYAARTWGLSWGAGFGAASAYAFSGYFVSITNNLPYFCAAAALPWAASFGHAFVERGAPRALLGAACATATVALVGDPMNFAVALAGLLFMARPWGPGPRVLRALRAGAAAGASVALAGAQMIPAFAARAASVAQDQSLPRALNASGHPLRLLEWWLGPVLLDERGERVLESLRDTIDPVNQSVWVDSQYFGAVALTLALLGAWRFSRSHGNAWALAWGTVFLMWLGRFTPVYEWAYRAVPLWKSFRYPEKLSPWLLLGLALAAGFELDALGKTADSARRLRAALFACGAACAAVALLALGSDLPLDANVRTWGFQSALVCALPALTLHRLPQGRRAWLPASLVAATAFQAGQWLYAVGPVEALTATPDFVAAIRADHAGRIEPARVWSRVGSPVVPTDFDALPYATFMAQATGVSLRPVTPALFGIEGAESYLPALSKHIAREGLTLEHAALWGTRYVVSLDTTAPAKGRVLAKEPDLGLSLHALDDALPRAFITASLDDGRPRPASEASARIEHYAPLQVKVTTEGAGGMLVLNDAHAPGWVARVDGVEVPMALANGAMRGIAVSAGRHQVSFDYDTSNVVWGLGLSLATLLGLGAFALFARFPKERVS